MVHGMEGECHTLFVTPFLSLFVLHFCWPKWMSEPSCGCFLPGSQQEVRSDSLLLWDPQSNGVSHHSASMLRRSQAQECFGSLSYVFVFLVSDFSADALVWTWVCWKDLLWLNIPCSWPHRGFHALVLQALAIAEISQRVSRKYCMINTHTHITNFQEQSVYPFIHFYVLWSIYIFTLRWFLKIKNRW